jgi:hypothetical protein
MEVQVVVVLDDGRVGDGGAGNGGAEDGRIGDDDAGDGGAVADR